MFLCFVLLLLFFVVLLQTAHFLFKRANLQNWSNSYFHQCITGAVLEEERNVCDITFVDISPKLFFYSSQLLFSDIYLYTA